MTKLVNDIKRGDLANCIVLHDFTIKKPNLKKWTEYVAEFFSKYEIIPTRIGGHRRNATKYVNINNGIRFLEANNYDTDHISMVALPPKYNSNDLYCAIFSSLISMRPDNTQCTYLTFDNKIVEFDTKMIDQLALDLIKLTGARYGYGFQRLFSNIVGYEWGALSGECDEDEEDLITKWMDVYAPKGAYKTGYFRDIYPVNIISKEHLANIVEPGKFFSRKKDLSEWISANKKRGKLVKLSENHWSWHIEPNNIYDVREGLRHTGIILCI